MLGVVHKTVQLMSSGKPLHHRIRDFAVYRSRPLRGWLKHRVLPRGKIDSTKLHVGCGMKRIEGWTNVDLLPWPEVDLALDVTRGLPFEGLTHIFAEHFLEHLEVSTALEFLRNCHRALGAGGRIRISTPNLEWTWRHVVELRRAAADAADSETAALRANRAFYGWGHRFLWSKELLYRALESTGFGQLVWCRYGESEIAELRGLEQHETYDDTEDLPHVLVIEGVKNRFDKARLEALRSVIRHEFLRYVEPG